MTQSHVVLTLPTLLEEALASEMGSVRRTSGALTELFTSAQRSLKVIAPYVDPTFTSLIARVRAPIQVLTTPSPGRPPKPNPVLERCATLADLRVRYLNERRDRALVFQAHAKAVIADGGRAYVGSANLTDTSVHYNFELGLILEEPTVVRVLTQLFDALYERIAVPAGRL